MSEVKGQEPLPQATERLLQATTRRKPPAVSPVADYFALSVTVLEDGTWAARSLSLDKGSLRVVPNLLDQGDLVVGGRATLLSMLRYWAEELSQGG